ncbi:MAG: hypothetical protein ABSB32_03370 [Thermodesulfobacteriota bacterium]
MPKSMSTIGDIPRPTAVASTCWPIQVGQTPFLAPIEEIFTGAFTS